LEREVGPIRFEPRVTDAAVLGRLMRLKSEQYRRSGKLDHFTVPWVVEMLHKLQQIRSIDFSGVLSALYVGDNLAAAHMGMQSRSRWHGWFIAYDRRFYKYSPGLILLLKMIEHATTMGLQRFDLANGPRMLYKERLMTGADTIAKGSIRL
jgi:CelD/BcsL family acetyltransferase involved in cellulose biosynthesis